MPGPDLKLGYDADLTIRQAARIKEMLAQALTGDPIMRMDINPDAAVDLSFVQLTAAARQHAKTAGGGLSLVAPAGGKLRDVLTRAGFVEGADAEELKFWFHLENAQ